MTNRTPAAGLTGFDAGGDRRDALFDALAHPRRRYVLHSLRGSEDPTPVATLAAELAARESTAPAPDRSADGPDRIATALVHTHLPKMAHAGLVSYDEAGQTVSATDRTAEAQSHLETAATTAGGD